MIQAFSAENLAQLMLKLDYQFIKIENLKTAISTKPAQIEHPTIIHENNDSLALIGDGALHFILSKKIYELTDPEKRSKGIQTRQRIHFENNIKLAQVAKDLELKSHMFLGKDENNPVKNDEHLLATSLEALIGAIYLDKENMKDVENVVFRLMPNFFDELLSESVEKDPLSKLNEEVQLKYRSPPEFEEINIGDVNNPRWRIGLKIGGSIVYTTEAKSKKEAKLIVAKWALDNETEW